MVFLIFPCDRILIDLREQRAQGDFEWPLLAGRQPSVTCEHGDVFEQQPRACACFSSSEASAYSASSSPSAC